jgi:hypothetical protein
MLTKKIEYEGLQGRVTEEFLFHITQAQLLELNLPYVTDEEPEDPSTPMGMAKVLQDIIDTNDNVKIYAQFKKIVLMAVGKKSEDGKRFLKSEEIRQDFESTEAYSELIIELMEDAEKAAKFFAGIMPEKVQEETRRSSAPSAEALASTLAAASKPVATPPIPFESKDTRVVPQSELASIPPAELREGLADGSITIGD